ncbi:MAG: hypothetical protein ACEPOZ_10390 [Marinifilaceae bacterium]
MNLLICSSRPNNYRNGMKYGIGLKGLYTSAWGIAQVELRFRCDGVVGYGKRGCYFRRNNILI